MFWKTFYDINLWLLIIFFAILLILNKISNRPFFQKNNNSKTYSEKDGQFFTTVQTDGRKQGPSNVKKGL